MKEVAIKKHHFVLVLAMLLALGVGACKEKTKTEVTDKSTVGNTTTERTTTQETTRDDDGDVTRETTTETTVDPEGLGNKTTTEETHIEEIKTHD